jgi:hypothetical protein
MGASSSQRSGHLSIFGKARKTIASKLQSGNPCEAMSATGLQYGGDEPRKSHVFPVHRQAGLSRLPAQLSLLVGTTNRQSSSLNP